MEEEFRYVRLLHTKEEVVEASNRAYSQYLSMPNHDEANYNHRKWWPYADCIPTINE